MSTIATHPTGNKNFRYLIESLAKKKKLRAIFTNVNFNSKLKIYKLLPKEIKYLIKTRDFGFYKNNIISVSPKFEIARVILDKLNKPFLKPIQNKYFSNHILYERFAIRVAKKIKDMENVENIYAYEGAALEIFKEAKKQGIKCIYELPTLYWKGKEKIYKYEKKKYPNYKKFFISEDTKIFAKRVDQEINLADQIIVPSLQVKESLKLYPKKNLNVDILNYPFGKFLKIKKKNWYNNKRKLKILFVGMLEARKGLHHIIETLKLLKTSNELKNFHITIIGSGTMLSNINNYLKEVEFYPSMSNDLVLKKMKNSDIYLCLSSFEGFALAAIEAMSMGMAVICSKSCGFTESCTGNDVIKLNNITSKKIFNLLMKLKKNPALIKNIGINALKTCKKYQINNYKNSLINLI